MDPSAIDPVVYTGSGGPVPNGAFLFEGGAVDTNDLLWSKQKQAEQRVLESYAKREEKRILDSFKKQQEQMETLDTKAPLSIAHIVPPKTNKIPQKKLLSALISVKPAKHTLSPASETESGNKRPRNLSEDGDQPSTPSKTDTSEISPSSKQDAKPSVKENATIVSPTSSAAKEAGNSVLAGLADYSDSEEEA